MPNIVMVGFGLTSDAENVRNIINDLMRKLGKAEDAVTTALDCWVHSCSDNSPAPYLIVRSSKKEEASEIAELLHKHLGLGIEIETIDGFIPTEKK
jgi:hypothetical protein